MLHTKTWKEASALAQLDGMLTHQPLKKTVASAPADRSDLCGEIIESEHSDRQSSVRPAASMLRFNTPSQVHLSIVSPLPCSVMRSSRSTVPQRTQRTSMEPTSRPSVAAISRLTCASTRISQGATDSVAVNSVCLIPSSVGCNSSRSRPSASLPPRCRIADSGQAPAATSSLFLDRREREQRRAAASALPRASWPPCYRHANPCPYTV
jgi:hypothetical protein